MCIRDSPNSGEGGNLKDWLYSPFANDKYLDDYVGTTITETAVLAADDEILQDDSGWLRAYLDKEYEELINTGIGVPTYEIVMAGQPKRVYEAIMRWNDDVMWHTGIFGNVTVDGWLVDNRIYPKTCLLYTSRWV